MSVVSGLLLALAFSKNNLWWLAWVALVPFFFALNKTTDWREAVRCGLSFGLVFFGIHLFWVTSLFRFAGWWVVTGWLGLAIFQTIFILLFTLILRLPAGQAGPSSFVFRPVSLAMAWVAIEWLRGLGPFGVTAGVIGYSQADFLPIIQIASIFTVYGVSFVVVFFNAAVAEFIWKPATERCGFLLAVGVVVVALAYGFFVLRGNRPCLPAGREVYSPVSEQLPKVALVQPNIDQFDKMNPALVMPIFELQEQMTRQAATFEPAVIVWPETAVFTYALQDRRIFPHLQQLARETKAWLLIGTPYYEGGRAYNSLVSISPSGEVVSRYDKEHLVPFGEYLPFRPLLYPFLRATGYFDNNFFPGKEDRLIEAAGQKIAAAVCFESTFPGLIRRRVGRGGDFILTVTNDGWFGDSDAAYQHWQAGVLRAVENRRYFFQVGNTGFSGLIDPYGRVLKRSRLNARETILLN